MAGEDKTEQATPRRRKEAREKGQVTKSTEVNAAVVLFAGFFTLQAFGPSFVDQWQRFAASTLSNCGQFTGTFPAMTSALGLCELMFVKLAFPVLLAILIAGVTVNFLQTGFVFSAKPLTPDFTRINIFQGVTRLFSQRSAVELLKTCVKASIIGYVLVHFFQQHGGDLAQLSVCSPEVLGQLIGKLCAALLLNATLMLLTLAVLDYIYQRYQFEKSLKMTKEEIKEEFKRSEGDPLIKSRIRQRQREMSRRRMMADVPKATVIVTNPTHIAVALRYIPGEMAAPVVIAKGERLIAEKIKDIARQHRIPVMENVLLARTLFKECEIGETIPAELYQAVAEVIAFVFRQSGRIKP